MEIAFWIGLGLIVLFVIGVIRWLIRDFKRNGH